MSDVSRGQYSLEHSVSSAGTFREVMAQAVVLGQLDVTVLIQGESGTGKEELARIIHFNSRRRGKPIMAVDCAAIPENLLEAELFGYQKGSIPGAVDNKEGKFELASLGTLFLDGVEKLPPATQTKLLRVLEKHEIAIAGNPIPKEVDVRIIASANPDLAARLNQRLFREDLYARLSLARLIAPPLRQRIEDIPLLVHQFASRCNKKFKTKVRFSLDAVEALMRYRWPGNIPELENVVETLVIFKSTGVVTAQDLPSTLRENRQRVGTLQLELPEEGFSLEELEKNLLVAALEKHDWNQTRTARYLGMTRNTIIYRMQKYGLRTVGADVASITHAGMGLCGIGRRPVRLRHAPTEK